MEILEIARVTTVAWWLVVSVMALSVCLLSALIAASNDAYLPAIICAIIALAAIAVIVFAPSEVPTDKMSYTVEITDPAQYQILVEKGYTFKRLFENKEIYTIIGDVLQ
jgi:membrane protein YdbS with pleckstrin-like domain